MYRRGETRTLVLLGALVVTLTLLASTVYLLETRQPQTTSGGGGIYVTQPTPKQEFNATPNPAQAGIGVSFTSWDDIKQLIETLNPVRGGAPVFPGGGVPVGAPVPAAGGVPVNQTAIPSSGEGASSGAYGGGEVQVQGIFELDVTATDGYMIYVAVGDSLVAVDGQPPEDMNLSWVFNSSAFAKAVVGDVEVLVSDATGNRTVGYISPTTSVSGVFTTDDKVIAVVQVYWSGATLIPPETWLVSLDKATGTPQAFLPVSGYVMDARLYEDTLAVVSTLPTTYNGMVPIPRIMGVEANVSNVALVGNPTTYTMLTSYNITSGDFSYLILLGPNPSAMYMDTEGHILLSMPKPAYSLLRPVPAIEPGDVVAAIEQEPENPETLIALYNASPEGVSLQAYTMVPGIVMSQWMMDITGDEVRVITQSQPWIGQEVSLYIYSLGDLSPIGNLTSIAVNENVHAALFMGDTLYLVTFRQTDPLFAIDLSDPAHPSVIGFLEAPGFDEFILPLEDNLLVGIGREGRSVRVTLYSINDNRTVTPLDRIFFSGPSDAGQCYSWSPALERGVGHRAVTIYRDESMIFVPVTYECYSSNYWGRGGGVLVAGYTDENLELLGFASHPAVARTLYIGDTFYTVAPGACYYGDTSLVKAWSIASLDLISEYNYTFCPEMGGYVAYVGEAGVPGAGG